MLTKGFLKVGGKSTIIQIWEKSRKTKVRYFNCQKEGHLAKAYKNMKICGYCTRKSHYIHNKYHFRIPKCVHYGGFHRTKDYKY